MSTRLPFATRLREICAVLDAAAIEFGGTESDDALATLKMTSIRLGRMADALEPPTTPRLLTPAQGRLLAYVRQFIAEKGVAPTRQEIGTHFSYAPNAAQCHLQALQLKGALTLLPGLARGIRLNTRTQL